MTDEKQLLSEICERQIAMERVLLIVAKRVHRTHDALLELGRTLRGRIASVESLIMGRRK